MWHLRVRTFEMQDGAYSGTLVLEHVFVGATKRDALGYSRSHAKSDRFYKASGGASAAEQAAGLGLPTYARGAFKGIKTLSIAKWERL